MAKVAKDGVSGFDSRTLYKESRIQCGFRVDEIKTRTKTRTLFEIFKQNSMLPWKNIRLFDAGGDTKKDWFVEYRYWDEVSKRYIRIKERFDMNRIKGVKERRAFGLTIIEFIKHQLQNGFNPLTDKKKDGDDEESHILAQLERIVTDMSLNASKSQQSTYREVRNRFTKFIEEKKYHSKQFHKINADFVKQFQRYMTSELELSGKTINSTISHMGMFWDKAIEQKICIENPWRKVAKSKAESKKSKERFEPMTGQEIEQVFEALRKMGEHDFILYLLFIYYAWARPVEITRIRVADIDMKAGGIRFRAANTKNKKSAIVQIVPQLMKHLEKIDWAATPAHFFLFSKDNYKPGIEQITKYAPNVKWKEIVKDGLGIAKDMYSLKHTGNIDYLQRNKGKADLKWQQSQNRHSSSAMTERYVRNLGVYFVDTKDMDIREL